MPPLHSRTLVAAVLAAALSTSGVLAMVATPAQAAPGVVRPAADGLHDHDIGEMVDPYADGRPGMDGARIAPRAAARTVSVNPSEGPDFEMPFRCGEEWVGSTRSSHSPSRYSIDFNRVGDVGRPVLSSARGVIYRIAWASGYGNYVIVDHGEGYSTLYAHLQSTNGAVGQVVDQGSVIGFLGSTGRVTGPHLHFEQRLHGNYFQPYFNRTPFVFDRTIASKSCADIPLIGDWDGDGIDNHGLYRPTPQAGQVHRQVNNRSTIVNWGGAGDVPLAGDWDGNGIDQPGIRRPGSTIFVLRGEDGAPSRANMGGHAWDKPLPGQWVAGDPKSGLGVYDNARKVLTKRMPDLSRETAFLGARNNEPVVGDWNGDGTMELAVFNITNAWWTLQTENGPVSLRFGEPGDIPIVGDWNGDGTSEIAVYRPSTAMIIKRAVQRPNTARAKVTYPQARYGIPRG